MDATSIRISGESAMARASDLEKMSYSELVKMEMDIGRLKTEKQNAERAVVKQKLIDMANAAGFDINDIVGKGRKGKGTVAIKYRDPKAPQNTWTGRGRTPRWMVAAMKGGKAKKDDFLID
jgi:DNA-binding protein H-NS